MSVESWLQWLSASCVYVYTYIIGKVSTVCAYLSRILVTVTLPMRSDFLYQLRSHRCHFVKFVLCLCLFLCVKCLRQLKGPPTVK